MAVYKSTGWLQCESLARMTRPVQALRTRCLRGTWQIPATLPSSCTFMNLLCLVERAMGLEVRPMS